MLSNMACSLIEHKKIQTTVAKAKALRKYVEPLITKAKTDTTHSRRVVFSYLQNKEALKELFGDVINRIGERPGGYTRILKLGNRLGDNAEMALIELVDFNEYGPEKAGSDEAPIEEAIEDVAIVEEEIVAPVEEAVETVEETVEEVVETVEETVEEVVADDLKKIEGIGPKIASILNEAGVMTFADLAGADVDKLKEVLEAAGSRYKSHDPSTWPRQADLAAAGNWDELKQLQDELDGGKEK
ncbi:UNVERIFIED_CONTAM: hypothetical protein GTU68_040520 [Idotea baltica]|nr:hypothetical protein [Idotea baltica]